MKNGLIWFCRIAVGLLFIFSGLIKANDPLGFSYKLEEYFEVFHITFLNNFALTSAILLCALEMLLGFALLIGARAAKVAWGLLLLIIFFGFLTFYSAFFKVVQTCGCFGDAIPLTPWQSFGKDMILLVLVAVLFVNRTKIKPLFSAKAGDKWLIGATVISVGFGLYTYNFLPIVDFLPYKIGANIPAEMDTPPNAPKDVFVLTYHLKNKKTKETKVMTDKEYLSTNIWKDANWEVIGDPENRMVKKGYEPKIRDLSLQDAQRNDFTKELFASPFYTIIIVAYDLDKTNDAAINRLNALAINATQNFNIRTILLTSNSAQSAQAFAKAHKLVSEIFYADGVPLKTMMRSNPGVILLKGGVIVNKWHYHSVPTYDYFVKNYFQKQ
ncbi:BT_3928 family protein [Mucilaginibacter sp.]|uniref:BT_3928 family protein n=1 Tax=Mucilaginibacter sp. TaxID=1882438 RepID=UPI0025E34141|nr:BT_3928 family protein [Mucilaginibacter sp.]